MKAFYAHDNEFIMLGDEVYSESQFHSSFWQRYLYDFESLLVFARKRQLPDGKKKNDLELSSAAKVSFAFGPNLSTLKAQIFRRGKVCCQVRNYLKDMDVVIVRLPSELGLIAIKEARRAGIPWAVEVVGCIWDGLWNHGKWAGKLYAPFMMAKMRMAIRDAPFAIYVTRRFLQHRYPNDKGVTAFCSNVEIPLPSNTILEERFARIHTQVNRPVVFGLIGTLKTRYKGIQTVFEALSQVRGKLPAVVFRILGVGDPWPWRVEAERYGIEDLVTFDGPLSAGEAVFRWLDAVDIYLQPSFSEGLPRALIEAMSRGCPVIASTCAGIPELLEKECLIRPGDAVHLGRLLINAVADSQWQNEQAVRNWKEASKYSIDKLETCRRKFWSDFAKYAGGVSKLRF